MKRISKKIIAISICFIMLLGTVAIGGDGFIDAVKALNITASAASSGTCGDNLTWTLDDEGTLKISGRGEMINYISAEAPWVPPYGNVINVVISSGVTSISKNAFSGCTDLENVTIGKNVTNIGDNAFFNCTSLKNVTIPDSVTSIGTRAFCGCSSVETITVGSGVKSIGEWALLTDNCASINVSENNTVYDSRNNCNAVIETSSNTLISGCKNTTIPSDVIIIVNYEFW